MPGLNLTRDEASERADILSVHHYDIDLDLTTGAADFRSHTRIEFDAVPGASSLTQIGRASCRERV